MQRKSPAHGLGIAPGMTPDDIAEIACLHMTHGIRTPRRAPRREPHRANPPAAHAPRANSSATIGLAKRRFKVTAQKVSAMPGS